MLVGMRLPGHMLRSCEKALHKLAADEAIEEGGGGGALFVVVAIEVHFQAIDLPLGNVLCFLTGPGSDAMSQVMFPSPDSVSFALPLRRLLTPSDRRHRHSNENPVLI